MYPQPVQPPMYPAGSNQMIANAPVGAMHAGPNSHSSSMNVIVNQPSGSSRGPIAHRWMLKPRPWNAALCGCFENIGVCCCVLFCFNWYHYYLSHKMDETCCMPVFIPYAVPAMRLKLRAAENIEGSIIKDCCASYWCYCCVLCQIENELNAVEKIHNTTAQYGA